MDFSGFGLQNSTFPIGIRNDLDVNSGIRVRSNLDLTINQGIDVPSSDMQQEETPRVERDELSDLEDYEEQLMSDQDGE